MIDTVLVFSYNATVKFSINFNEEKNQLLKASRGICFDDIVDALEDGKLVANIRHFKKVKYPNQFLFLVDIKGYIYVAPYVKDFVKKEIFLKTVYPSQKFTKLYGRKNEKK